MSASSLRDIKGLEVILLHPGFSFVSFLHAAYLFLLFSASMVPFPRVDSVSITERYLHLYSDYYFLLSRSVEAMTGSAQRLEMLEGCCIGTVRAKDNACDCTARDR